MRAPLTLHETALVLAIRIFNNSIKCGVRFKEQYERLEKCIVDDSILWEIFFEFECLFYCFTISTMKRILKNKQCSNFVKTFLSSGQQPILGVQEARK